MVLVQLIRLALWPTAVAAGGATAALAATGGIAASASAMAAIVLAVGLTWCLTGLAEWHRRPRSRIGPLLVLVGFAWFGSQLDQSNVSLLYTVGLFLAVLFIAAFGHVLLAFPTGRLQGRFSRAIVAAAYLDTTVVVAASVVFRESEHDSVDNLALIQANEALSAAFRNVARGIGVVVIVAGLSVLVHRWRHATPPWRRAVAPVLWLGAGSMVVGVLALVTESLGEPLGGISLAFFLLFGAVPLAFEVGLLRSRLARGAVADLVVELGRSPAPGELQKALARALHDPSLTIAYWLPERRRYVDIGGNPVDVPAASDVRAATVVEREGQRVAALVHDASLRDDPRLVEAVGAAAGLALENERLQADLRARLEELKASRARIVEAMDEERRRIERNLHDGTQQRLVSVSMALGLAGSKLGSDSEAGRILEEAREMLGAALQELRELSHGIHPGILTERGLRTALQELAYVAPVPVDVTVALEERLPEPVEAVAYYVVAEALANVAKYASATTVTVNVDRRNGQAVVEVSDDGVGGADPARGSGLRGLADRLDALGGVFAVESRPREGTLLRAEIPCGS